MGFLIRFSRCEEAGEEGEMLKSSEQSNIKKKKKITVNDVVLVVNVPSIM